MKSLKSSAPRRAYRMKARAESAAETGRRILGAVVELHSERFHDQITLDDIADRAGVTVQTVLRRFGSKDGLLEAAADWVQERVHAQRSEAPVGDVAGAVDNVLAHYEETGAGTLRLLAQEKMVPQFGPFLALGRQSHYRWVEEKFRPFLASADDADRLRAQLIVLTDVYVWKLLRLDLGLAPREVRKALIEMIGALMKEKTT